MDDIILKYSLLNKSAREEIKDFIDFLINKKKINKSKALSAYKKKILKVSAWTDEDLKAYDDNRKTFDEWKLKDW